VNLILREKVEIIFCYAPTDMSVRKIAKLAGVNRKTVAKYKRIYFCVESGVRGAVIDEAPAARLRG
jgi:transposase-like protein